jgi:uncharacterized cupredoxin-like copper-binding protein
MTRIAARALVAAIAVASPSFAQDAPQAVEVILSDYDFTPRNVTFRAGQRYRLHLENRGGEMHEFTAPAFFPTADIENPDVLTADGTDVVLQPGETKDILLTPRRPGHYALYCADHDWMDMVGGIDVQ